MYFTEQKLEHQKKRHLPRTLYYALSNAASAATKVRNHLIGHFCKCVIGTEKVAKPLLTVLGNTLRLSSNHDHTPENNPPEPAEPNEFGIMIE